MLFRPKSGRFHPELLFRPESLALVGVETPLGARVAANLAAGGFTGPIAQVTSDGAVADTPDLALLCTDTEATPAAIRALAARGARAGIVLGGGANLRALANETGLRSLGAHSFGIAVPAIGLEATQSHMVAPKGRVALVSQSASLCRAIVDWAEPNGVGFSSIVGIGVNDDLGFAVVLDWLSRDPGTGTILLDIARIKDPRAFLSAVRAAARLRPVVALRAGGRMADPDGGADAVFEAALRRCGVLTVATFDDLLAGAETLTRARPARGETIAIASNARGAGRLAADAALREGLGLAGEPIHADGAALGIEAARLAAADEVGVVLAVIAPEGPDDEAAVASLIGLKGRAPILACVMGETTGAAQRRRLAAAGLPVFATPSLALQGIRHLAQDRRNRAAARELPGSAVLAITPDRARAAALIEQGDARAALACYGLATTGAPGAEVRLTMRVDPLFGPAIGVGPAGPARAFHEEAVDLPPLNLPLARALVARTHVSPEDIEPVAQAIVQVSQLVVDFPDIATLEIDPLHVGGRKAGGGATAWAAAATIRRGPPARLAIAPYPAELAATFDARGTPIHVRPIRPEDATAHAAFIARLSPEDLRYRFFSALRTLPVEQTARLTQIDYVREMAFVAEKGTDIVGIARLVQSGESDEGEFAIIVQPDMKRSGLARHLMTRLMDWGRARGLREIVGQVLADNQPMLRFVRALGFAVRRAPDEPDIMEARMTL